MANFDFITNNEFKASLEADYNELCLCINAGAWKAVHVLAGSIIEALLLDSLQSSGYTGCSQSDLLHKDLGAMIAICKSEHILSQKSADLSSVIRAYRNLIHPGRVVRLGEVADQHGATVAQALVEIVVEEVTILKKQTYGYTAEQIFQKIDNDYSALSIINHILRDANPREIERLLMQILPKQLLYWSQKYHNQEDRPQALQLRAALTTCFRNAFAIATDDIKQKALQNFVTILKEEQESVVLSYEVAFFRASDLAYVCPKDVLLIKEHLRGRLGSHVEADLLVALAGIGKYLTPQDVEGLIDPLVKAFVRDSDEVALAIRQLLEEEYPHMLPEVSSRVISRLDGWIYTYQQRGNERVATSLKKLKEQINDESDPFADE